MYQNSDLSTDCVKYTLFNHVDIQSCRRFNQEPKEAFRQIVFLYEAIHYTFKGVLISNSLLLLSTNIEVKD